MKQMRTARRTPPIAVKSILVWKAKMVRPSVMAAQAPTAIITSSMSYLAVIVPSMNPSAKVKRPRKMKLCGVFLRTPSQQARVMMQTNRMTMARMYSQEFSAENLTTESILKMPMMAMVTTSWTERME